MCEIKFKETCIRLKNEHQLAKDYVINYTSGNWVYLIFFFFPHRIWSSPLNFNWENKEMDSHAASPANNLVILNFLALSLSCSNGTALL